MGQRFRKLEVSEVRFNIQAWRLREEGVGFKICRILSIVSTIKG
jgi:hypothetical protein